MSFHFGTDNCDFNVKDLRIETRHQITRIPSNYLQDFQLEDCFFVWSNAKPYSHGFCVVYSKHHSWCPRRVRHLLREFFLEKEIIFIPHDDTKIHYIQSPNNVILRMEWVELIQRTKRAHAFVEPFIHQKKSIAVPNSILPQDIIDLILKFENDIIDDGIRSCESIIFLFHFPTRLCKPLDLSNEVNVVDMQTFRCVANQYIFKTVVLCNAPSLSREIFAFHMQIVNIDIYEFEPMRFMYKITSQ